MSKILLVEDEAILAKQICDWLKRENYLVEHVATGPEALSALCAYEYDIVLLDWLLPGMQGIDVCRAYRASGGKAPILMLTAKSTEEDKEKGLDTGADDYLSKPFGLRELSARIRALLRRTTTQQQIGQTLKSGKLELDPAARRVTKNGEELHFEPREFSLLEFFMRHPNQVFDAEALINRVWDSESMITSESVRSYIKTLRRKLDGNSQTSAITTLRGSGYRFEG